MNGTLWQALSTIFTVLILSPRAGRCSWPIANLLPDTVTVSRHWMANSTCMEALALVVRDWGYSCRLVVICRKGGRGPNDEIRTYTDLGLLFEIIHDVGVLGACVLISWLAFTIMMHSICWGSDMLARQGGGGMRLREESWSEDGGERSYLTIAIDEYN